MQLRHGVLRFVHIALKASLKGVPFGGWSLQLARFIFLRRKWELDEASLTRMLQLVAAEPTEPYSLLFFPVRTVRVSVVGSSRAEWFGLCLDSGFGSGTRVLPSATSPRVPLPIDCRENALAKRRGCAECGRACSDSKARMLTTHSRSSTSSLMPTAHNSLGLYPALRDTSHHCRYSRSQAVPTSP